MTVVWFVAQPYAFWLGFFLRKQDQYVPFLDFRVFFCRINGDAYSHTFT
jgi:hypothetical protein